MQLAEKFRRIPADGKYPLENSQVILLGNAVILSILEKVNCGGRVQSIKSTVLYYTSL